MNMLFWVLKPRGLSLGLLKKTVQSRRVLGTSESLSASVETGVQRTTHPSLCRVAGDLWWLYRSLFEKSICRFAIDKPLCEVNLVLSKSRLIGLF